MSKRKLIISREVINAMFYKNLDEHKKCFENLVKRTYNEGFDSIIVHPDFQAEHNKNGKYLVYIESKNLFYSTNDPDNYVRKCVRDGIKPDEICAINEKGEFYKLAYQI